LAHLYRANETDPCRKVTFTKIRGKKEKKGRPPIRWLDSVKGGEITHKSEANGKA
jgi:hypothetical protein